VDAKELERIALVTMKSNLSVCDTLVMVKALWSLIIFTLNYIVKVRKCIPNKHSKALMVFI